MRILLAIPHFHGAAAGEARHGSLRESGRARRVAVLREQIMGLRDRFGGPWYGLMHVDRRVAESAPPWPAEIRILVCTVGDDHLLGELDLPPGWFEHRPQDCDPRHLGFACHRLLLAERGGHDLYGYLEDDILIEDGAFFRKIDLFNRATAAFDPNMPALLQPQRYERLADFGPTACAATRAYVDYRVISGAMPGSSIELAWEGLRVVLEPTSHPHAGCFFLDDRQLAVAARHPAFGAPSSAFVTALDSAATLAIGQSLRVYKPALGSFSFLEVRHGHPGILGQIGQDPDGRPVWRP
ncbi:MAG: hypothetical protein HQL40_00995 [Alphaproteobacteria bacterium]|nr:hypothetical protein [Alphaproteobacteria bacterium]